MTDPNATLPPQPVTDKPCAAQVRRVMEELGIDQLQARNHVRCLQVLRTLPDPRWQKHD